MYYRAAEPRSPLRSAARPCSRLRIVVLLGAALLGGCGDNPAGTSKEPEVTPRAYNPDWEETSHGKGTPAYDVIFPQGSVNRIDLAMTAAQWDGIRQNMRSLWGFDFGAGGPCCGPTYPTTEPSYVDVSLRFNGKSWKHVGLRLKGNSSLEAAWRAGSTKLPFRLKFDEFEKAFPMINGQRFYGFQELSFAPGFLDPSLIREKVAADIFRMAGVPAARTAFYRVYIDFGQGSRYAGLYTLVEVIDDTMVRDQFGSADGNLYKPESTFKTFVQSEFEKKNNKTAADYSDVRAMITALNSELRTSDPARWRAGLEAVFNVDHFLKWLAVNNAIVNWDTYGSLAHNYYLYNDPVKKLTWIPWDHNFSLHGSPGITGQASSPGSQDGMSLSLNEVDSSWPLIRYLADDPVYYERYRAHMKAFHDTVLSQGRIETLFDRYHGMIAPYVVGADGERPGSTFLSGPDAFVAALPALHAHIASRRTLVAEFLR